jgi:hypothetical protein
MIDNNIVVNTNMNLAPSTHRKGLISAFTNATDKKQNIAIMIIVVRRINIFPNVDIFLIIQLGYKCRQV